MAASAASDTWAALLIQSASPGAIFRFLERRRRAASAESSAPDALFLSDALSGNNWRAMPGERAFLRANGAALSRVFPPAVTLLYKEEGVWGFLIWEKGEEIQRAENPLPPSQTSPWKNFFGAGRTLSPPVAWAQERKFPLSRVPGAVPGAKSVPLIEYHTVSGLDQRDLLLETGPRLYRFEFGV